MDLDIVDQKIIKSKNLLPNDHKYLTFLKKVFRHEFRKNGFRRISTPFFEEYSFFEKIFKNSVEDNVYIFEFNNNKI
jgi:histidyl-tRNA synthetase